MVNRNRWEFRPSSFRKIRFVKRLLKIENWSHHNQWRLNLIVLETSNGSILLPINKIDRRNHPNPFPLLQVLPPVSPLNTTSVTVIPRITNETVGITRLNPTVVTEITVLNP